MSITYNTTCWEKDWEAMLTTGYLEENIKFNEFDFEKKVLWINNVDDYDVVESAAQELVDKGVLTDYHRVEDHIDDAMKRFKLTRENDSLGKGYPYSVGPLCGLHTCKTKWFLHFTGDAKLFEPAPGWITRTLAFMAKDKNYVTGNLMWSRGRTKISWPTLDRESHWQDDDFAVGYGFSDQCFLAETKRFQNLDYNMRHALSDKRFMKQRKPGTSFEKRIEAWKLNNGFHRVTYKKATYVHAAELNRHLKKLGKK